MKLFVILILFLPLISLIAEEQKQSIKNIPNRIMPGHYLDEQAPIISLPDHQGVLRSLSDYKGKKVILYFFKTDSDDLDGYPFNKSENIKHARLLNSIVPWCTHNNIEVIGIGTKPPEDMALFKKRLGINYVILSDKSEFFAGLYGAVDDFYKTVRTSLLIDETGVVRCTVQSYEAATNVACILIHLLIATLPTTDRNATASP